MRAVTATIARLWAFMIALMSPVSPRNGVSGTRRSGARPAADPLCSWSDHPTVDV